MKKVLIIICITKEESVNLAHDISDYLSEQGYETDFVHYEGFSQDFIFKDFSFVITLGGDGTVLYAARNCVDLNIPIFSVNLGEFGFLASIEKQNWKKELQTFLQDKANIQERQMIHSSLIRDGKTITQKLSLNEVVINAKRSARSIALNITYNNVHLCKLKSDGVIISTATGSTAYSASAGGPILSPNVDAFLLTPINSFSLSSRPIILSSNGEIVIEIQPCRTKELSLIVDGQEGIDLLPNDKIIIKKNKKNVRLILNNEEKFYSALRSKLNWTGGPHA